VRKWTRIAAYGLILDQGRILLCRLSKQEKNVGMWTLPGGGLDFGESPEMGAVREIWEETGLEARLTGHAGIDSKVIDFESGVMHAVRILYWAEPVRGELQVEIDGSTDACEWFSEEEALCLPLVDLAQLGVEMAFRRSAVLAPDLDG
jgi:8-oxo-dGTP diphosphatase